MGSTSPSFEICNELPAAKHPDVTITPGKKQVMSGKMIPHIKTHNSELRGQEEAGHV